MRIVVTHGRDQAFEIPETMARAWSDALRHGLRSAGYVRSDDLDIRFAFYVRDGTLLRELTDPRIYVARGGRLRQILDMQTFDGEGFVAANVGLVPDGQLSGVPKGRPLASSHPNPMPIPRSWAERASGQIATADGDQIDYVIQAGQKPADKVEFVLELCPGLTWRKELVLRDGAGGEWTIGVQDATRSDRNGLFRNQLPAGSLVFRKAKTFGIVTDIHGLGNLDQLPEGACVTFTWRRD